MAAVMIERLNNLMAFSLTFDVIDCTIIATVATAHCLHRRRTGTTTLR
jgi:hypothetical protein